jgi:hypothetical protein
MPRYGHKLNIERDGHQLIAACECGMWHRVLPLSANRAMTTLIAVLTERHDRHLERLGRPSAEGYVSNDALPALPDMDGLPEA